MKRRDFLQSAAVIGSALAIPTVVRAGIHASSPTPLFALARSLSDDAGARFAPLGSAPRGAAAIDMLRIRIGSLHRAAGTSVLHELGVNAMFEHDGAGEVPLHAWRFVHGSPGHASPPVAFVAAAGRMRRFELDYRLAGDLQCRSETCTLTRLRMPALVPGRYVLLGPRRAAAPVDIGALRHSGDAACPLGDMERDFDYLTLRVEAIA